VLEALPFVSAFFIAFFQAQNYPDRVKYTFLAQLPVRDVVEVFVSLMICVSMRYIPYARLKREL
jgi:hypothetical protein